MRHPGRHARFWQTSPLQHCASLMQEELAAGKALLHPAVGGGADLAGAVQTTMARSVAGTTVRAVPRTPQDDCAESLMFAPLFSRKGERACPVFQQDSYSRRRPCWPRMIPHVTQPP